MTPNEPSERRREPTDPVPKPHSSFAWQPFTPRGVAAFAGATLGRLLLVQWAVAILSAGVVVWFLHQAWFPVIRKAIQRLPEQGEIRNGRLEWPGGSPTALAEGRCLALTVDLEHAGQSRSPAHLYAEFGRAEVRIYSLLGYWPWAYPRDYVIAFNRVALDPWWGAWAPVLLWLAAGLAIVALLLIWAALATLYTLPARLAAFFGNRQATLDGCWRLAGAALMPGAVLMAVLILLYGAGMLDLVRLGLGTGLHFAVTWIYLGLSPLQLPRLSAAPGAAVNPFVEPPTQGQ